MGRLKDLRTSLLALVTRHPAQSTPPTLWLDHEVRAEIDELRATIRRPTVWLDCEVREEIDELRATIRRISNTVGDRKWIRIDITPWRSR
jgi:hypothetical protein